ncbi:MAG TPA: hypothetical protein VFK05_26210 [Polyangiaceae bacterium]|nr:hypothetical protein [Polyangiaceae bacterium]
MTMQMGRALLGWGSLAVCLLGLLSVGCADDDEHPASEPSADFKRGTKAGARYDACGIEPMSPLSMFGHFGPLVTIVPNIYSGVADCANAAANCDEVDKCDIWFHRDDLIDQNPPCGDVPTDHCEGNVAKQCEKDGSDGTFYEVSYDCSLAQATCVEGVRREGGPYADCKASEAPCAGHATSYCDGTRAVICDDYWTGVLSPAVYDCADAWGSGCFWDEGDKAPKCGEVQCDDGKDNDEDGKTDCDDYDCPCAH